MQNIINFIKNKPFDFILIILGIPCSFLLGKMKTTQNFMPTYNQIIDFVCPIDLAIFSLIVAIIILYYQLYYNRYNAKKVVITLKYEFWVLSIISIIETISLIALWIVNDNSFFIKYICFLFFIYLIVRFFLFIAKYKKYSILYYIEHVYKKNISKIIQGKINGKDFIKIVRDLREHLEESIEKKETLYLVKVIEIEKGIYQSYLEYNGKICCSNNAEDIEAILSENIIHNFYQLLTNDVPLIVLRNYTKFICDFSCNCLSCEKNKLFCSILDGLFSDFMSKNEKIISFSPILEIIRRLFDNSISKSQTDATKIIIDKYSNFFFATEFLLENEAPQKQLVVMLSHMLKIFLRENMQNEFKFLYEKSVITINRALPNFDSVNSKFCILLFIQLFEAIMNKNNEYLELYLQGLFSVIERAFKIKNKFLIQQLGFLLNNTFSDSEIRKRYQSQRIKFLYLCIDIYPEAALIYIDNYTELLKNNKDQLNDEFVSNQKDIISQCIITNQIYLLNYIFKNFENIISIYEKQEVAKQKLLFKIFDNTLDSALHYKNYECFNLIYNNYYKVIRKLHNEDKISASLLTYIFSILNYCSSEIIDIDDVSLQNYFVYRITHITEVIDNLTPDDKENIVDIVFHTAINAVESQNENLVRICSNHLGWFGKESFDRQDIKTFQLVIKIAKELFNITSSLGYSEKLLSFLGTLFIVLGSYVKSKGSLEKAYVIEQMLLLTQNEKTVSILRNSKKLRYLEHRYWGDFFDNKDAKKIIQDFFTEYETKLQTKKIRR